MSWESWAFLKCWISWVRSWHDCPEFVRVKSGMDFISSLIVFSALNGLSVLTDSSILCPAWPKDPESFVCLVIPECPDFPVCPEFHGFPEIPDCPDVLRDSWESCVSCVFWMSLESWQSCVSCFFMSWESCLSCVLWMSWESCVSFVSWEYWETKSLFMSCV
jgi:hypothetical protein